MAVVVRSSLALLLVLLAGCYSKEFRFDYKFSKHGKGWLKYHQIPATWDEARMRCHAEGAVLASPLSSSLRAAIVSFVKRQDSLDFEGRQTIFTGVHATFSKGDYSSIEGVPLLRLDITWAPGEPGNRHNLENCLVMMTNGTMADARCDSIYPYVCYKKDANLTMTECGTTDPEYTLQPTTGSCYKIHRSGLPWSQAYMTCVAEGAYLAIIDDDVEAEVIKVIFATIPEKTITSKQTHILSVGFQDWGQYGSSFMTIHGEAMETKYNSWVAGVPNNYTSETSKRRSLDGQYCGSFFRDGKIDDSYCFESYAFICEKDPNSLL